jgi:hypothetical protein
MQDFSVSLGATHSDSWPIARIGNDISFHETPYVRTAHKIDSVPSSSGLDLADLCRPEISQPRHKHFMG